MPTNPTLTKPTLAAGVSDAACLDVTFTNCGSTGISGPSQAQCDAAYDFTGTLVTAGYQKFKVAHGGSYTIKALGAAGGNHGGGLGGYGAVAKTTVTLTAGDVLLMAVGQKGGSNPTNGADWGGAGGGGTFVARVVVQGGETMTVGAFNGMHVEPLVIAGGGSGMDDRRDSGQCEGGRNQAEDYTTASLGGHSSGGGGWTHVGGAFLKPGSFLSGMEGTAAHISIGGFGGGGSGHDGGGGGGGYDGGDCTIGGTNNACYGGSSLNGITDNSNNGHGSIHLKSG